MRSNLKDQGSVNANKWAQQRKEQLERSRQSSRERTNFAAMGDMAVGGARGSSAQRMNSQERSRNPPPSNPTPTNAPPRTNGYPPARTNSNQRPAPMPQQRPPATQQPPDVQNQLRLLKSKMTTGATNSRQGSRNEYDSSEPVNYRQQFTPSTDWDDTPIKANPVSKQPPTAQRQPQAKIQRNNSYQEEEQAPSNKKPPMLQKKNTVAYEPTPPPARGKPTTQSRNQPKKVEYETFDSNPFNYNNPHDEQPAIATGKKQMPVPMYADEEEEDLELYECPEGCGRRFNEVALDRHVKVCQKVFQSKRKQFNTKAHRILDGEHAKLVKNAEMKEKQDAQKQKKATKIEDKPIQGQKKAKWLAQSEAFRAIIRGNQGVALSKEETAVIAEAQNIGMVQCPYCSRKFNETAGKRHIEFCETKAKQNKIKQAPVKPMPQQPPRRQR